MTINYINWDIDPEIFHIGFLSVRWYGLLFASAFIFGYMLMKNIFTRENLSVELLDKLSMYMLIGTVLGARLGHVFFYQPDYYLSHPSEILQVWKGGLASHGAAIGILIALYLFARKAKKSYLWVLDRVVITVALAGFFIRTGNLMNSEIVGKVTDLPWGFVFAREIPYLGADPRHPSQIYEALSYLLIFSLLSFLFFKKGWNIKSGRIFGLFLVSLFSVRFLIEFVKHVQVEFESSMLLNMGQLLSIPFILIGFYFWFRPLKSEKN